MKSKFLTCKKCSSEDIYYYVDMIVRGSGTMNKDGTIEELSYHDDKPLKYKTTGYCCITCGDEYDIH